jgi:hypothetical protein
VLSPSQGSFLFLGKNPTTFEAFESFLGVEELAHHPVTTIFSIEIFLTSTIGRPGLHLSCPLIEKGDGLAARIFLRRLDRGFSFTLFNESLFLDIRHCGVFSISLIRNLFNLSEFRSIYSLDG